MAQRCTVSNLPILENTECYVLMLQKPRICTNISNSYIPLALPIKVLYKRYNTIEVEKNFNTTVLEHIFNIPTVEYLIGYTLIQAHDNEDANYDNLLDIERVMSHEKGVFYKINYLRSLRCAFIHKDVYEYMSNEKLYDSYDTCNLLDIQTCPDISDTAQWPQWIGNLNLDYVMVTNLKDNTRFWYKPQVIFAYYMMPHLLDELCNDLSITGVTTDGMWLDIRKLLNFMQNLRSINSCLRPTVKAEWLVPNTRQDEYYREIMGKFIEISQSITDKENE